MISTRNRHRRLLRGALTIAGSLFAAATVTAAITSPRERKRAPDFALAGTNRATVRLSDYRGRVVLLDFWATWCEGCKTEIPWYIEFEKKYERRGLAVIGISMDSDGWKSVRPFVKEHRLNYPVVIGDDSLAGAYGVRSMPVTLLIDPNGRIAESHAGVVDRGGFEADLKALLRESADPKPQAAPKRSLPTGE